STVSPRFLPSSAEPSGDVGETVPEPPTALISTVSFWPLSPSMSTTDPTPTSSADACSTISAPSRRARSVRMRASSKPCSFFAAWYSKFSARSPNSRAFLIAATTSVRRGPSSSASSSRSASACLGVSFSPKFISGWSFVAGARWVSRGKDAGLVHMQCIWARPRTQYRGARRCPAAQGSPRCGLQLPRRPSSAAPRRVHELRLRELEAGLFVRLDLALKPRDARDLFLLLRKDERDADAAPPGAARATHAVRVHVRLLRRVEVDHVR